MMSTNAMYKVLLSLGRLFSDGRSFFYQIDDEEIVIKTAIFKAAIAKLYDSVVVMG